MKDFNWTVADAPEVEAGMTLNLPWLELNDYKPCHKQLQNKLLPDEYKDILSNLISKNIVQEKTLETTYGSPPETLIKYDQYLAFTNEDTTREIAKSEALEQEQEQEKLTKNYHHNDYFHVNRLRLRRRLSSEGNNFD
jgi:hypothetical protein